MIARLWGDSGIGGCQRIVYMLDGCGSLRSLRAMMHNKPHKLQGAFFLVIHISVLIRRQVGAGIELAASHPRWE
jgi:hypothetical protein